MDEKKGFAICCREEEKEVGPDLKLICGFTFQRRPILVVVVPLVTIIVRAVQRDRFVNLTTIPGIITEHSLGSNCIPRGSCMNRMNPHPTCCCVGVNSTSSYSTADLIPVRWHNDSNRLPKPPPAATELEKKESKEPEPGKEQLDLQLNNRLTNNRNPPPLLAHFDCCPPVPPTRSPSTSSNQVCIISNYLLYLLLSANHRQLASRCGQSTFAIKSYLFALSHNRCYQSSSSYSARLERRYFTLPYLAQSTSLTPLLLCSGPYIHPSTQPASSS